MSSPPIHPPTALTQLTAWFAPFHSALIAYSGGVDSALVLAVAHQALGQNAIGCIAVSPSYPRRELESALAVASRLSAPVRMINTLEHLDPNYAANPVNRCFYCKSELYNHLSKIAREENIEVILDGGNATDLTEHRPGRAAAIEHKVRSPLAELSFTKENVRALARHLNLPVWNKPAMPCLSSRVPHGVPIVPQLLNQIEQAEDALHRLGFTQFRVRHHDEIARIELPAEDFPRALTLHKEIHQSLKSVGYKHITLDLGGFRSQPLALIL